MPLIALAAIAFLFQHGFNALRIVLNNTFEQRVIFDLRSDLYSHMQQLPLTWFDNRATGDLMTRVLEDVTAVERMLIDGIEQGIIAVLQIVIVSIALFQRGVVLAVLGGALQLGDLVAFLMLVQFLYDPIGKLHQLNQLFQAGRAAGERVFEIMDESPESSAPSTLDPQPSTPILGDVRFTNVCFAY